MANLPVKNLNETSVKPDGIVIGKELEVQKQMNERKNEKTEERQERSQTREDDIQEETGSLESGIVVSPIVTPVQVVTPKDSLTLNIETILEEDLTDLYLAMNPNDQKVFKQKGEETLTKIRQLFNKTQVSAKKIFQLIAQWLRVIPGVNRFFLEQEAKIKTDKILMMKDEHESS